MEKRGNPYEYVSLTRDWFVFQQNNQEFSLKFRQDVHLNQNDEKGLVYSAVLGDGGYENIFQASEDGVFVEGEKIIPPNIISVGVIGRPNLNASAWTDIKIPLNVETSSCGTRLSFNDTKNCVVVGAGVSQILINGSMGIYTSPTGGETNLTIKKGDTIIARSYATKSNDTVGVTLVGMVVSVEEGDEIYMYLSPQYGGSYKILGENGIGTYMTIQAIA